MKVSELIKKLEVFDPDMSVIIKGHYERDDLYEPSDVTTLTDMKELRRVVAGECFAAVLID